MAASPWAGRVIFLHIPKTAGTTLRKIIFRNYPAEALCFFYDDGWAKPYSELETMPRERLNAYKLVGGHLRFGVHEFFNGTTKYITFLRKPVDRIVSLYCSALANSGGALHTRARRAGSLAEFVLDGKFNNGQARLIGGPKVSPKNLSNAAFENLEKHFAAVGLVEDFETSMQRFGKILGWRRLSFSKENATHDRIALHQIPAPVIRTIEERNSIDMDLYARVEAAPWAAACEQSWYQSRQWLRRIDRSPAGG